MLERISILVLRVVIAVVGTGDGGAKGCSYVGAVMDFVVFSGLWWP